ncbi:hypothetical protein M409DRAFT_53527 [Zasmidium cellare ATCC 36951]|uniref:Extracellular membrane protein CFEM domain-containing protein n=1 Tax=Zasmidium cellare ATCC 36951 TaxID=1080233 RepID=A0A6A6CQ16_ZASCE|nr:uncharacterized protein M409DRAFT_53527 [Zasmidium cellare ATCC 36951]KAF2168230.1 hypothetical protein M409DRAFT_53527 [Zasmidium cellare ATCC 36951]
MRFSRPTLALLALPTTILAVSLSDFTPRVSDLPSSCQTVYTQSINGCQASDFSSGTCSTACVKALNSFTSKVKTACGNKDIEGGNIISTFLSGGGPVSLCPNANRVLGGDSDSTTAAATTSAPAASKTAINSKASSSSATSTSSSESTSSTSTSSSSPALGGTATATSLASSTLALGAASSSGILVDTSTVPTATSTPTSSSTGNAQANMNDNSGGGSPFDSEGNMSSLAPSTTSYSLVAMLLTTGMVLFATLR